MDEERGWRVMGLHHVAFAYGADGPEAQLRDALHLEEQHEETGPGFVERMFPVGQSFIQTLEADGEGPVTPFVERRGPALHHVALEVDTIDVAIRDLGERGVRLVDERPRAGGMGTRIAFVHPSAFGGMLVELVEVPRPSEGTDRSDRSEQPAPSSGPA
jgi:methylmalonyl-CoA/ethylmalonyl-CoA epimerase